ncbi:hypothetical protein CRUP_029178 [Coryphaenoides rupestris]|nr:hypothetical protein CRUP_029178 [Coryphaenoides rupestris]
MGKRCGKNRSWKGSSSRVGPQPFIIQFVTLTVEPAAKLQRDANATLRCRAGVSATSPQALSRHYTLYKDGTVVYTKTTSSTEDLLYLLSGVRVSNTGKYKCQVNIGGKESISLARPLLHINKREVGEGMEVTAQCLALDESGPIIFYFYDKGRELQEERVTTDQAEVKLHFMGAGVRQLHCDYAVLLTLAAVRSQESNRVELTVNELDLTPVLEMSPGQKVFEGDQLNITCSLRGDVQRDANVSLFLSHGFQLLIHGHTRSINQSLVVFAKHSGDIECRLVMGNVVKFATKTLSVIELFSAPRLSLSPAEVFQRDPLLLTCRSEVLVAEQLQQKDVNYAMHPDVSLLLRQLGGGRFSGMTPSYPFNYSCIAQVRGIQKASQTLLVTPKVSVAAPRISVVGRVVLGKPFEIQCVSEDGSLPINYTLWRNYEPMNGRQARFSVTVQQPQEVGQFMCEADNSQRKEGVLSKRLNASVIVPLSQATLTVVPSLADVSEGNTLILICGVTGTPPITFKWFRTDGSQPLYASTTNRVSLDYQIPRIGRDDSATYYCEASNLANNTVHSQWVTVEVHMALWKKGVIAAACLLLLCVAVLACVLRYKTSRDAAPRYDGTEGRATNGTADSVAASLPADISNRSSYSIPATV